MELGQSGAVIKGIPSDGRKGIWKMNFDQFGTIIKGSISDFCSPIGDS